MDLILEIGLIFVTGAVLAYISKMLKQPMIPAYILAGLLLVLTGLVETNSFVATISELGIAFLLFIVGLEIDIDRIKDVGFVSTIGGSLLCIVLFGLGFLAGGLLGFAPMEAIYVGLVVTFSSTMIVVKLLADRQELDTLHGRVVLGILLVQDVFAIIALFVLSTIGNFSFLDLFSVLLIVIALGSVIYMAAKVIFPIIFKYAARSEELLFITATAVCLLFIAVFHLFGFSIAIGAFLAGLTLGNLPYSVEIISLIRSLRDFFAVVFFVALGMQLNVNTIQGYIVPIIVITLMIVLLKPLLIMFTTSLFGYKNRPAFLTSISLAQASEFALILLVFGVAESHITQDFFSAVILVTIITMASTAYLFEFEYWFYKKTKRFLHVFERLSDGHVLEYMPHEANTEVILAGCDRLGYSIFQALHKLGHSFLVVDYNPELVKELIEKRIPTLYGDIGDVEVLHRLNFKKATMVISTVPDKKASHLLIRKAKEANRRIKVIVTSMHVEEALELYKLGADYVILPHFLGGERMGLFLEEVKGNVKKIMDYKLAHIKELRHHHSMGHNQPKRHSSK